MHPLLPAIVVFISVSLLAFSGYKLAWGWFSNRVQSDAKKYESWIDELFIDWTPEKAMTVAYITNGAIAGAMLIVLLLTASVVFAIAAAIATYWIPLLLYKFSKDKRMQHFEEQLPDAINVMVASVRAGLSLPQAVEDVAKKAKAPISQEFGLIAKEYKDGGASIEAALDRARRRLNLESFTMFSTALLISAAQGGDLLSVLERIASSIRELAKLQKKIIIETSEVRAQEKIILFLTPIFGVLVCLFDPSIPDILFNTLAGNLIIVVVVALQIFSVLLIRRIVNSTV